MRDYCNSNQSTTMTKSTTCICYILLLSSHVIVDVKSFTIKNRVLPQSWTHQTKIAHHYHPSPIQRVPRLFQSKDTRESSSSSTATKEKNNEEDDSAGEAISDLDARVLQSLLEDQDLDLKSEQSLKKMLENKKVSSTGTKNSSDKKKDDASQSQFSSTVFKVR